MSARRAGPAAPTDRRALALRARWGIHAVRAGGALAVLGSVLPWVYVPLAGTRLPAPGILGWGALTLLLGVWMARRPAWWNGLAAGLVCAVVGWRAFQGLPPAMRAAALALEGRVQPLNDLLARFALPPLNLFDLGASGAALRGPGPITVLLGAALALTGGAVALRAARGRFALGRCAACGHRDAHGRLLAYCVACGAPMPDERACAVCHTLAEPGDICCGVCGNRLPGVLSDG